MRAFHNTPVKKRELIASLKAHAAADRLVKGRYWGDGKGCAVGCSIHDFKPGYENSYIAYEELFNIPAQVAALEDGLFEALPDELAMRWPLRFTRAVRVGANLSMVWPRFAVWMLTDPAEGVIRFAATVTSRAAIKNVSVLYQRRIAGDEPSKEEWDASAAWAASAASAARDSSAAWAARAAWAAWAARDAWTERQSDKLIELIEDVA